MIQRSQGATALVGLPELVVGAQVLVDGEWWLYVETPWDVAACAACGTKAVGHGRTRSQVRDLPIVGVASVLVLARRRWRCGDAGCEVSTWSEHLDAIEARASMTERARARLADMVNIEGFTIAAAGADSVGARSCAEAAER